MSPEIPLNPPGKPSPQIRLLDPATDLIYRHKRRLQVGCVITILAPILALIVSQDLFDDRQATTDTIPTPTLNVLPTPVPTTVETFTFLSESWRWDSARVELFNATRLSRVPLSITPIADNWRQYLDQLANDPNRRAAFSQRHWSLLFMFHSEVDTLNVSVSAEQHRFQQLFESFGQAELLPPAPPEMPCNYTIHINDFPEEFVAIYVPGLPTKFPTQTPAEQQEMLHSREKSVSAAIYTVINTIIADPRETCSGYQFTSVDTELGMIETGQLPILVNIEPDFGTSGISAQNLPDWSHSIPPHQ